MAERAITIEDDSAPEGSGTRHSTPSSSRRRTADLAGSIRRALVPGGTSTQPEVSLAHLLATTSARSDSFRAIDIMATGSHEPVRELEHGPLQAGFPTTIASWELAVHQERNRHVDTALVASVLKDIRGVGMNNVGESHHDVMSRITPEHVRDWRKGIGLTDHDIATMENNSRTIGRFIPSSSTLFNLVNYGVVPWLPNMGSKDPRVNAAISIGIAGLLQPLMTALAQTPIIAALDTWRKKMGPTVTLDKGVHARVTPEAAGAQLQEHVGELKGVQAEIETLFREMATAYHVPLDEGAMSEEQVNATVQALHADGHHEQQADFIARLTALGQKSLDAEGAVRDSSDQLRMSTGVQDRQWQSTKHQIAPRIARAATSYVTPVGRAIERSLDMKPTTYTTVAAVGAAAVSMAWQHYAAGEDEVRGAASVEEKLNIAYGTNYLTPEGKELLRRGGEFQPEHVDKAALRALASGPATQMLDRVRATLQGQLDTLSPSNPEHASKIAEYEHDLQALADNALRDLTPGGQAEKLMHEVIGRGGDQHPFKFAAREGWNKMTKLEITAQIGQRLGVAWMLIGAGNVGATAGGRMINALKGGSSKASLPVQFGAATLSTAMGAVSAVTNFMPVNVKNERRADPANISMGQQVWNSVKSPLWQLHQHVAAKASSLVAGEAAATKPASTQAAQNLPQHPGERA